MQLSGGHLDRPVLFVVRPPAVVKGTWAVASPDVQAAHADNIVASVA
jgi:hypothetical protein